MGYDTEFTSDNMQKLKDAGLYNEKLTFNQTENTELEVTWQQAKRDLGLGSAEKYSLNTYHTKNSSKVSVFVAKTCGNAPHSFNTSGYSQGGGCLHFALIHGAGTTKGGNEIGNEDGIFFVIHPNAWGPYQKRFAQSGMTGVLHAGVEFVAGKGGNMAGAAIGSAVGSIVPGVGTLVGAGVGAGVGFAVSNMTDRLSGDYLRYIGE